MHLVGCTDQDTIFKKRIYKDYFNPYDQNQHTAMNSTNFLLSIYDLPITCKYKTAKNPYSFLPIT